MQHLLERLRPVSFPLPLATITAPIEVQHIPKFRSSSKSPVCGTRQCKAGANPVELESVLLLI